MLYQLSYKDIVSQTCENYLLKDFKNHAADLAPALPLISLKAFCLVSGLENVSTDNLVRSGLVLRGFKELECATFSVKLP